ncbi:DUF3011 domain-containing protein [Sandaracinobacteroides saxicola]|nr:DUF3011 domain-containing protein [Sandaracinobacteroides saxicola]
MGTMRTRSVQLSFLGIAMAAALVLPGEGVGGSANAGTIACGSVNGAYHYCAADTGRGVQLQQQLSRAPCRQAESWGYDRRGVWVDNGCAATFLVGSWGESSGVAGRGGDGGKVSAAIVGGLVGALLGGAIGGSSHSSSTYVSRTYVQSGDDGPTQDEQRAAYAANQQAQRDQQDRLDDAQQRAAYLANQNNQLEIQASQDREQRDNARAAQAEAEDARRQAEIRAGEADENRQAREAESNADSNSSGDNSDSGAAAEETPQ